VLLASNAGFPKNWTAENGVRGESVLAVSSREFLEASSGRKDTVWVIDCDPNLTFELAALSMVIPFRTPPLVSVDIVLRRPSSLVGKLELPIKRLLLGRVNRFIHYFRDLRGYEEVFGIDDERSSFVPFKPNLRDHDCVGQTDDDGYVLCFGRSLRDFDTFFEAMNQLPYPAAIAQPDFAALRSHGARFTRSLDGLPCNVRVLEDDGSEEAQVRILQNARLLVLPILGSSIAASGISTALNGMLMGKCVIGSEGPGMSDVFGDKILTVPPEDHEALASVIRQAWEDGPLRMSKAQEGRAYASSLGGKRELDQRIIDQIANWYSLGFARPQ
jgi:glycosyltransferase involved in cell wall biosynthesis